MAVANAWGSAALLLRPSPITPREARFHSLGGPVLRSTVMGDRCCSLSLSCRCTSSATTSGEVDGDGTCSSDSNWNQWTRYFSEIDQAESRSSALKAQLEEAARKENFLEAAKLKAALAEATSKDVLGEILSELKNAIEEERFSDASRLYKLSGQSLVGWWAGLSEDADDPFGRIVRITPAFGRYVAKSYSPRQLVNGSSGSPLFEVFLMREEDGKYKTQVVALQRPKENLMQLSPSASQTLDGPIFLSEKSSIETPTSDIAVDNNRDDATDKREKDDKMTRNDDNINNKDSSEEVINSILNFLKERIPGFKVKVVNVTVSEEIKIDSESPEQLMKQDDEINTLNKNANDESKNSEDIQGEMFSVGEDTISEESINTAVQLFSGEATHNKEDALSKTYMRVPAEMKDMKKNCFILHVPGKSDDTSIGTMKPPKVRVAAVAAQSTSDLLPSDVAKAFLSGDKAMSKVSKEVQEVIKLAFSHAQRRGRLSKTTIFNRIISNNEGLDPFVGLYVGAFGPYGTEVVQLRRKYGNWNDSNGLDSEMEFFEYVEAIKLTGDLNVPAGQVTFRAKIGKENRRANKGLYPEELGVVAIYKGEGRVAEPGFKNPRWVDGELLQLSGKGLGPYLRGMELGFLYVVPEQSFLVLFERLKLPD